MSGLRTLRRAVARIMSDLTNTERRELNLLKKTQAERGGLAGVAYLRAVYLTSVECKGRLVADQEWADARNELSEEALHFSEAAAEKRPT